MLISGEVTLNGKDLVLNSYFIIKPIEKRNKKVTIVSPQNIWR